MLESDYQIVLIIITIIGFIISTAFYVYFVYLPATRAEDQLDIIAARGEDLITLVNRRTDEFEENTTETLKSVCETIKNLICTYNKQGILPTPPCSNVLGPFCGLTEQAYPNFCNQFSPFPTNICDCVITT